MYSWCMQYNLWFLCYIQTHTHGMLCALIDGTWCALIHDGNGTLILNDRRNALIRRGNMVHLMGKVASREYNL